jgi:hypothetical protein|nr:DUF3793 family protein [uncultured Oscillibacter sp.]
MERTFESVLVEQCAPTLVGLKPASLFRYQPGPSDEGRVPLARWKGALAARGIRVRVLKACPRTGAWMIYLYREVWITRILCQPEIQDFLRRQGYRPEEGCQAMLTRLSRRLCLEEDYPHEIGVFLGYPLEDVEGFIRHRGRDFTCCGYWKVYGDAAAAQRRFDCYRRCTRICLERLRRGTALTKLIAA